MYDALRNSMDCFVSVNFKASKTPYHWYPSANLGRTHHQINIYIYIRHSAMGCGSGEAIENHLLYNLYAFGIPLTDGHGWTIHVFECG